jgi:selenide,water dikinase
VTAAGNGAEKRAAIEGMRAVNRRASEALVRAGAAVHAVTDVTGYGLAGHGWEMAERSSVVLSIDAASLPVYPGARRIAEDGTRTGGDPRNRDYVGERFLATADPASVALCMDPQTSGGLLAAVDPSAVTQLEAEGFVVVGRFLDGAPAVRLD